MATKPAKSVQLMAPVPFDTAITTRLDMKYGKIEVDEENELIHAKAFKPNARELIIPFSNIAFIELASEADLAPKAAPVVAVAPPIDEAPPAEDKVVFEKDAKGNIVEKKVKR